MSDVQREPWQGKAIRNVEMTCWESSQHADVFKNVESAKRGGWKKINGKWHCPDCAARKDNPCPTT